MENKYVDIDSLVYTNKLNLLERVNSKKNITSVLTSSTNIVIYNDDRKNLVAKTAALKTYGQPNDENAGNFKVGKISINFKPLMKSGEYYELKPQSLGVTLDKYIPLDQLKKELKQGIKNHPVLDDTQKADRKSTRLNSSHT